MFDADHRLISELPNMAHEFEQFVTLSTLGYCRKERIAYAKPTQCAVFIEAIQHASSVVFTSNLLK